METSKTSNRIEYYRCIDYENIVFMFYTEKQLLYVARINDHGNYENVFRDDNGTNRSLYAKDNQYLILYKLARANNSPVDEEDIKLETTLKGDSSVETSIDRFRTRLTECLKGYIDDNIHAAYNILPTKRDVGMGAWLLRVKRIPDDLYVSEKADARHDITPTNETPSEECLPITPSKTPPDSRLIEIAKENYAYARRVDNKILVFTGVYVLVALGLIVFSFSLNNTGLLLALYFILLCFSVIALVLIHRWYDASDNYFSISRNACDKLASEDSNGEVTLNLKRMLVANRPKTAKWLRTRWLIYGVHIVIFIVVLFFLIRQIVKMATGF